MAERRVVITGMGVVTALGDELPTFWEHLLAGKSGVKLIESFDASAYPVRIGGDTEWISAAAGYYHAVGFKADASLWAWGGNWYGQLGDGSTQDTSLPTRIGSDSDWVSAAAGEEQSAAVREDGSLWVWGYTGEGQLPVPVLAQVVDLNVAPSGGELLAPVRVEGRRSSDPYQVILDWTASVGGGGVAGYRIYRDGELVGTLPCPPSPIPYRTPKAPTLTRSSRTTARVTNRPSAARGRNRRRGPT
jgi:hypothetical protein